jgi:hypothetical protein
MEHLLFNFKFQILDFTCLPCLPQAGAGRDFFNLQPAI